MGNGGVDQQLAVDCFILENSLLAADSSKKTRGYFYQEMGQTSFRVFSVRDGPGSYCVA